MKSFVFETLKNWSCLKFFAPLPSREVNIFIPSLGSVQISKPVPQPINNEASLNLLKICPLYFYLMKRECWILANTFSLLLISQLTKWKSDRFFFNQEYKMPSPVFQFTEPVLYTYNYAFTSGTLIIYIEYDIYFISKWSWLPTPETLVVWTHSRH